MLNERRGRTLGYDERARVATIEVAGGASGKAVEVDATVLLDGAGRLVGVDLEPGSARRVVVMIGAHEGVATTRSTRVSVSRDKSGEVASVVVRDVGHPA